MKRNINIIYGIELLILIFIIMLKIKNLSNIYIIGFFFIVLILLYTLCGYPRKKNLLTKDAIKITIICIMSTTVILLLLGLFVGFNKNLFYTMQTLLIKSIITVLISTMIYEIIRQIICKNSFEKKLPIIILTILYIILNIIMGINSSNINNVELVFRFSSSVVVPIVCKEMIYSYLSYNFGISPVIILRGVFELYHYILPITPNIGEFIGSVIIILLTLSIYLILSKMIKISDKRNKYIKKTSRNIFMMPLVIFLLVIVILITGIFNYQMIAIASNSMNPLYKRGDAIIYVKVKPEEVKEGDVIAFNHNGSIITHRVIKINNTDLGLEFETKGDNNNIKDNFTTTGENIRGIVKVSVKKIGYPTVWLSEIRNKKV